MYFRTTYSFILTPVAFKSGCDFSLPACLRSPGFLDASYESFFFFNMQFPIARRNLHLLCGFSNIRLLYLYTRIYPHRRIKAFILRNNQLSVCDCACGGERKMIITI